jgi:hypothetical protein
MLFEQHILAGPHGILQLSHWMDSVIVQLFCTFYPVVFYRVLELTAGLVVISIALILT